MTGDHNNPDGAAGDPPSRAREQVMSPWPVRLLVYAVLVVIAFAAIGVIDHHVMLTIQQQGL